MEQYGPGRFSLPETPDALYERHLLFDNVVAPDGCRGPRALRGGRPLRRDILSQRWLLTEEHL